MSPRRRASARLLRRARNSPTAPKPSQAKLEIGSSDGAAMLHELNSNVPSLGVAVPSGVGGTGVEEGPGVWVMVGVFEGPTVFVVVGVGVGATRLLSKNVRSNPVSLVVITSIS